MDPGKTPQGMLPPFEVAKALAYEAVIEQMEEHTGKSCWELLGTSKKAFTAQHLQVAGGGNPTPRAVQKHWTKAKQDGNWFPRKGGSTNQRGRPPTITQAQKQAIANKAMELKDDIIAPTPEKIRIVLPKKTITRKKKNQSVISLSDKSSKQCAMMKKKMTHGSSCLLCNRIV